MVCLCPPVRAWGSSRSVQMVLSELPVILVSRTRLELAMMLALLVLTMVMGHQLHVDQVRILFRVTGVILPGLAHWVLKPSS